MFGGGTARGRGGGAARPAGARGAGGWPAAPAFEAASEAGDGEGDATGACRSGEVKVGFGGFAGAVLDGTLKVEMERIRLRLVIDYQVKVIFYQIVWQADRMSSIFGPGYFNIINL